MLSKGLYSWLCVGVVCSTWKIARARLQLGGRVLPHCPGPSSSLLLAGDPESCHSIPPLHVGSQRLGFFPPKFLALWLCLSLCVSIVLGLLMFGWLVGFCFLAGFFLGGGVSCLLGLLVCSLCLSSRWLTVCFLGTSL